MAAGVGWTWKSALGVWLAVVGIGFAVVWQYASAPGAVTRAPSRWPDGTLLRRAAGAPQLLVFVHPKCSCSRATLGELTHLLARRAMPAAVIFVRPAGESELRREAERIGGVTIVDDTEGSEARRFGAATSGATLLYDGAGKLAFAGGLTASRGHEGSGLGAERILLIASGSNPDRRDSPVLGCPLHDEETP